MLKGVSVSHFWLGWYSRALTLPQEEQEEAMRLGACKNLFLWVRISWWRGVKHRDVATLL